MTSVHSRPAASSTGSVFGRRPRHSTTTTEEDDEEDIIRLEDLPKIDLDALRRQKVRPQADGSSESLPTPEMTAEYLRQQAQYEYQAHMDNTHETSTRYYPFHHHFVPCSPTRNFTTAAASDEVHPGCEYPPMKPQKSSSFCQTEESGSPLFNNQPTDLIEPTFSTDSLDERIHQNAASPQAPSVDHRPSGGLYHLRSEHVSPFAGSPIAYHLSPNIPSPVQQPFHSCPQPSLDPAYLHAPHPMFCPAHGHQAMHNQLLSRRLGYPIVNDPYIMAL